MHFAESGQTVRPLAWPGGLRPSTLPFGHEGYPQVYIGAVDRERGEDNMNIKYDITGLLTAVWKVTPREKGGGVVDT